MPPKRARKAKESTSARSKGKARASQPKPKPPNYPSESEMSESFALFALPRPDMTDDEHAEAAEADPDEEEDFIRVLDVRRALAALDLPKPPPDFFEADQRLVGQGDFVELAKTMRDMGGDADEDADGDAGGDDADPQAREIDHAFALFTTAIPAAGRVPVDAAAGRERRITLADLRRVARELREDVDDKVLRMMIEEANGEEGNAGAARGVSRDEFEGVMRRAGVFG